MPPKAKKVKTGDELEQPDTLPYPENKSKIDIQNGQITYGDNQKWIRSGLLTYGVPALGVLGVGLAYGREPAVDAAKLIAPTLFKAGSSLHAMAKGLPNIINKYKKQKMMPAEERLEELKNEKRTLDTLDKADQLSLENYERKYGKEEGDRIMKISAMITSQPEISQQTIRIPDHAGPPLVNYKIDEDIIMKESSYQSQRQIEPDTVKAISQRIQKPMIEKMKLSMVKSILAPVKKAITVYPRDSLMSSKVSKRRLSSANNQPSKKRVIGPEMNKFNKIPRITAK